MSVVWIEKDDVPQIVEVDDDKTEMMIPVKPKSDNNKTMEFMNASLFLFVYLFCY